MKAKGGFSLLELLTVLLVIGILAAMSSVSYARMIELSRVRDARSVLNLIYQAERLYRLDQDTYTDLATLVGSSYISDPDSGADPSDNVPPGSNANWNFTVVMDNAVTPPTFTATAARTGGGPDYDTFTITVNQSFTGQTSNYGGTHPLANQ